MYKLYQMYNTGDGIEKDTKEAFKWLLKMAEVAEDDQTATEFDWIGAAYYKLGTAYYKGLSVEQNYTESLKWFTKGSIKTKKAMWYTDDNVACMQMVIQFYQDGLGVKRDKKLAAEWLAKYEEAKKVAR
jgi:TPR repeat protein